ncbi:MAG: hypothetical protein MK193_09565 [Lentisphaeria bacterium]|nr:hypothetical protein [Lentisphaeria bacterium]
MKKLALTLALVFATVPATFAHCGSCEKKEDKKEACDSKDKKACDSKEECTKDKKEEKKEEKK